MINRDSILLLFGATGDLAQKKLFPAAVNLLASGKLPVNFRIAALGRRDYTTEVFNNNLSEKLYLALPKRVHPYIEQLLKLVTYHKIDFNSDSDYLNLKKELDSIASVQNIGENRLFYLAVAPSLFETISCKVVKNGLKPNRRDGWARLVVEKPFGTDLRSAKSYNGALRQNFSEEEILRTDHYLGKEMIRNIMAIRFANPLFQSVWSKKFIDHIQIEVNEEIGIDRRAGYFDKSGLIRDMLQSHILQMLALIAMEKPLKLSVDEIKEKKIALLRGLKKVRKEDVVIGQYEPDLEHSIKGYREEDGVASDSMTETFVALKTVIGSGRLKDVPVYIRTGKRMPRKRAEIIIVFKDCFQTKSLYPDLKIKNNILVIHVQPKEGAAFCFNSKDLGHSDIVRVEMDYCHNCRIDVRSPEAYEMIISEAIDGNRDIFTGWKEIFYEWKFSDRLIKLVENRKESLCPYKAGSWGPEAANDIIRQDGRFWIELKQ